MGEKEEDLLPLFKTKSCGRLYRCSSPPREVLTGIADDGERGDFENDREM